MQKVKELFGGIIRKCDFDEFLVYLRLNLSLKYMLMICNFFIKHTHTNAMIASYFEMDELFNVMYKIWLEEKRATST